MTHTNFHPSLPTPTQGNFVKRRMFFNAQEAAGGGGSRQDLAWRLNLMKQAGQIAPDGSEKFSGNDEPEPEKPADDKPNIRKS